MNARPCGSVFGSVRPSWKPFCCMIVNKSEIGFLPAAIASNWLAYLLAGLYASTIEVAAYWTYHFVNLGSRPGSMLSPPTLMKTFGLIDLAAISADSPSDGPGVPRYL